MKSLKETQAEIQRLKEEIDNLKKAQESAHREVTKAVDQLHQSQSSQSQAPHPYGEKSYWDSRYTSEDPKKLYEWYVPLSSFSSLLAEDFRTIRSSLQRSVLITGCGNSGLGEDLVKEGYSDIFGVDYSEDIVTVMNQRAKKRGIQKKVKYLVSDVTDMIDFIDDSISLVIDKGTLDAICSGGADAEAEASTDTVASSQQLEHAMKYLREVWRVLRLGGLFVLISTAPRDILQRLVVDALGLEACSNWATCSYQTLLTPVGGTVHYYGIKKRGSLIPAPVSLPAPVSRKESLMSGIEFLLQEARKAIDERGYEDSEAASMATTRVTSASATTVSVACPIQVMIEIEGQKEVYVAGEDIMVSVSISGDSWEDGDCICVVCDGDGDGQSPYGRSEQPFESLEYVDDPSRSTRLVLPSYAGVFSVIYVRFMPVEDTSAPKQLVECGRSTRLVAQGPILKGHPEKVAGSGHWVRRRSVGGFLSEKLLKIGDAEVTVQLKAVVEYLQGIRVCNIYIIPGLISNSGSPTIQLQRALCWIFDDSSSGCCKVVVEVDVVSTRLGEDPVCSTLIWSQPLPDFAVSDLDSIASYVEIDCKASRLVVRLKMPSSVAPKVASERNLGLSPPNEDFCLSCEFCEVELSRPHSISKIQDLPTGYFDNIMHELICCESISEGSSLVSNEIYTVTGTSRVGATQLSVCPMDLQADRLALSCKSGLTLLDFFNSQTAMLSCSTATAPTSAIGKSRIINTDSCAITCGRCGLYLGDGLIASDKDACADADACIAIHPEKESVARFNFSLSELRDVRFSMDRIVVLPTGTGGDSVPCKLTVEQCLSRTMVQLANIYNVASFCLYASEYTGLSLSQDGDQDLIIVRLLSKEVLFSQSTSAVDLVWTAAVRVSFAISPASRVMDCHPIKEKEARVNIPIQTEQFQQVKIILDSRKPFFGPSIFPNQFISYIKL